ncbi:uncharacterized protein V3H82_016788 [Fundulus diaphanus]
MARQLRLHFASRRSNTDPLSESLSCHGEESGVGVSAHGPAENLAHSSVHLKVIPLSPEVASSQSSSVFISRVNRGGCSRKSVLQISLQPCGKPSGELEGSAEDGDGGGVCVGSDGGSCNSSMASDAGYCSSNSIFEPELPEKHRSSQERTQVCRRSKVPLRRCSSLVIIPKSPCSTPPASPVGPAAHFTLPPLRGSHQPLLQASASEFFQADGIVAGRDPTAAASSGDSQPKGSCSSEFRDSKHMVHFNIPLQDEPKCKQEDRTAGMEQSSNLHSSSVMLRFAHQRPMASAKRTPSVASAGAQHPDAHHPAGLSERPDEAHRKLYRSTSACLFSSAKQPERSSTVCSSGKGQGKHCHHAMQRSFSLEVPYANTGISCHVSNPKLGSPLSPHVHIHLSPCCPAKVPASPNGLKTRHKGNREVSNELL